MKGKIKGGLFPDNMFLRSQLTRGTKVELEHTTSKRTAEKIAKIHLLETGYIGPRGKIRSDYYKELKKMEYKLHERKEGK